MSAHYKNKTIIVFTHFNQYNYKKEEKNTGIIYEKDFGNKKELYNEFTRNIIYEIYNKYSNVSYEERKKLAEKECIKEKEKLIKKSKVLDYDIDEKKCKDLKQYLESLNHKKDNIISLGNGLSYEVLKDKYIIYDANINKRLGEIEIQDNKEEKAKGIELESSEECFDFNKNKIIGLENKDILTVMNNNLLQIYRLKEDNYFLFQKIIINSEGFSTKYEYTFCGCTDSSKYEVTFKYHHIEGITGNKFFIFFNYGAKLYGLNEKKEYSLISLNTFDNSLRAVHKINENTFISSFNVNYPTSMSGPQHYNYLIEKMTLKKSANNNDYNCFSEELYEFDIYRETLSEDYITQGEITLKNKYFIVYINYYILITDFINNITKKFLICEDGQKTLYKYEGRIIPRNNKSDDEFIVIFSEKEYTLFKIIEKQKYFYIKVIGYTYNDKD